MPRTRLIRTTNAVDMPAAGQWALGVAPAVTVGRNGRAGEVSGTLIVGEGHLDVRIVMSMWVPDGSSGTLVEVEAALVESDPSGRWTFVGEVTVAGRTVPITVDALYHGVFRNGAHAWAELSFHADLGRLASRRRRLTIDADVIFDAPTQLAA